MSETWNYIQNGIVQGPVEEEVLKGLLETGQLGWEDLVWKQGLAEWTKVSQFPELGTPPTPSPVPHLVPGPAQVRAEAPRAMAAPEDGAAQAALDTSVEALRATKPWVRFLAVLGIIGTVLMVLGSMVLLNFHGAMRGIPAAARVLVQVFYLIMAGLQIPPAIYLTRYANRIGTLLASRKPEHLAEALVAQKSFWRYVGAMALILVIFYALIAVLGIGAAVVMGARHRF